jgi:2-dehydropantoate 2-reductase
MDVFRDPAVSGLARAVVTEGVAIGRADGARLGSEDIESVLRSLGGGDPGAGTSMLYDRLAGRPMEHEYLTGAAVDAGARHGVPTPLNGTLLTLLRALDANTDAATAPPPGP